MLEIAEKYGVEAEDVSEVLVGTYPIATNTAGKNYMPKTPDEAKFSLPYCVAVALIYGKVGLEQFSSEKLTDPKIRELSKRVKAFVDPKFMNARLGCAEVKLRTKSGNGYTCRVNVPKGYPKKPLTKSEIEAKFKALASLTLTEERVAEILRRANVLEKVNEIRNLSVLLR